MLGLVKLNLIRRLFQVAVAEKKEAFCPISDECL